jgi:hypothetical protein
VADESSVELADITYRERSCAASGTGATRSSFACRYDPDLIRGLWDEPQMEDAA